MTDNFNEQLKSENKKLLDSNKSLLSSNSQISDSINSGKLELEILASNKAKLEAEIESLEGQRDEAFTSFQSVDKELNAKNAELGEVSGRVTAVKDKYSEAIRAACDELNQLRVEHDKLVASHNEEIDSKKREIDRLAEQTERFLTVIKLRERELESLKQQEVDAIAELNSAIESKNLKIASLDKENRELEQKIADNKKVFDEINQLKNLSISLTDSKINLEKEISTISEQLPALTSQKEEIEKAIETLKENKRLSDEEYQIAKKKIFAIADKEREVNEKEEYVKGKFDEAGLTYE